MLHKTDPKLATFHTEETQYGDTSFAINDYSIVMYIAQGIDKKPYKEEVNISMGSTKWRQKNKICHSEDVKRTES